jgi:prepilin-type N-terminal cleavage/methylation domain-containing protein
MRPSAPSPGRPPRGRRGFTMIELIAVVIIVGVVMSIVAPRFRLSRATAVQLAGQQLAQDLDVSRTRALATRQMARVAFMASDRRYGGYLDHDGDKQFSQNATEWQALRAFGERTLPVGVTFGRGVAPALPDDPGTGDITFADNYVEFDSRGLVTPANTGGVVYLTNEADPSAVVAVAVAPSGNTRYWTWKKGEGWQ